MQKLISKYGLAAHLAILAVAPLFLFPFCPEGAIATTVLWLSVLCGVWVVMEPSRRSQEMLHDARSRIAQAIAKDPVFWLTLFLAVVSGVRFFNDGVMMGYDAEKLIWVLAEPASPLLPGSVAGAGYLPFAASIAIIVILQGARHALGKSARISFLFLVPFLAGISAAISSIMGLFGNESVVGLVQKGYEDASFAGLAYGLCFLMSIVSLTGMFERNWNRAMIFLPVSVGGSALGLFLFSPPMLSVIFAFAAALMLMISLTYAALKLTYTAAPKCLIFFGLSLLLPAAFVAMALPPDLWSARADAYMNWSFIPEEIEEIRPVLLGIAQDVWKAHPWLGTGLGSFALDIKFSGGPEIWSVLPPLQVSALNGWLQFAAELGIVGSVLLISPIALLIWTWICRLVGTIRLSVGHDRHGFVHFTNPVCWLGPIALAAAVYSGFFDVSVMRPDAIVLIWSVLALSASSFPVLRKTTDEEEEEKK